jgi:hypothetical protein
MSTSAKASASGPAESSFLYNPSHMPIRVLIVALEKELEHHTKAADALTRAINELANTTTKSKRRGRKPGRKLSGGMSAAGRKRIAEATKKRWALWRKKKGKS